MASLVDGRETVKIGTKCWELVEVGTNCWELVEARLGIVETPVNFGNTGVHGQVSSLVEDWENELFLLVDVWGG